MPRSIVVGPEEKARMRLKARVALSAALDDPAGGLVLAKWKDYQQKVNLKEELVLIPNIKDLKTIATQITGINFFDNRYPKLLKGVALNSKSVSGIQFFVRIKESNNPSNLNLPFGFDLIVVT